MLNVHLSNGTEVMGVNRADRTIAGAEFMLLTDVREIRQHAEPAEPLPQGTTLLVPVSRIDLIEWRVGQPSPRTQEAESDSVGT